MHDLLEPLLDTLIPPSADGALPGAGQLGLAAAVAPQLDAKDPTLREAFAALSDADFASLDLAARSERLEALERTHPAFIATIYVPTCTAYYQHPDVHRALGLPGEPPHPRGHVVEAGDLAGLERVKQRGPLYRNV